MPSGWENKATCDGIDKTFPFRIGLVYVNPILLKTFLIALLLFPGALQANTGFYNGSGETLFPVKNAHLRVLRERLEISPLSERKCYALLFSQESRTSWLASIKGGAPGRLGGAVKCPKEAFGEGAEVLQTLWRAEAVYDVEALEDESDVTLGFPVPTWSNMMAEGTAPGVASFKTWIDDRTAEGLRMTFLAPTGPVSKELADSNGKIWGYSWTASFQKGRKYTLKTTYEFGAEFSYDPQDYMRGLSSDYFLLASILYDLTPLNLWAPPPPDVFIKVTIPKNLSILYAFPDELKPSCLDAEALHYEIKGRLPETNLRVTFPVRHGPGPISPGKVLPLRKEDDWEDWKENLSFGQVKLTCSLVAGLKGRMSPRFYQEISKVPCQQTCE